MKILKQGAESIILLDKNKIIKHRIKKSYRIKEIDEKIRKFRTRSEAKLLERSPVNVPKVLNVDEKDMKIEMQYLNGELLKDIFDKLKEKERLSLCKTLGEEISKLHSAEIIHGDLTTSNFILYNKEIYFIDFGLGFFSNKTEDKAVDLHLLKEALEAKHFENWKILLDKFFLSYEKVFGKRESQKIFDRIKVIEKRGRYRH